MADNKNNNINIDIKTAIAKQTAQPHVNTPQQAVRQAQQQTPGISIKDIITQFTQLKQLISSNNESNKSTFQKLDKNIQIISNIEKENQKLLQKISSSLEKPVDTNTQRFDDKRFLQHIKNFFDQLKTKLTSIQQAIPAETEKEEKEVDYSLIQQVVENNTNNIIAKLQQLIQKQQPTTDYTNIIDAINNVTQALTSKAEQQIQLSPVITQLQDIKNAITNISTENATEATKKLNILIENAQQTPSLSLDSVNQQITEILNILQNNQTAGLDYTTIVDTTNIESLLTQFIDAYKLENTNFLQTLNANLLQILADPKLYQVSKFDYTTLTVMAEKLDAIEASINKTSNQQTPESVVSQQTAENNKINVQLAIDLLNASQPQPPVVQTEDVEAATQQYIDNNININIPGTNGDEQPVPKNQPAVFNVDIHNPTQINQPFVDDFMAFSNNFREFYSQQDETNEQRYPQQQNNPNIPTNQPENMPDMQGLQIENINGFQFGQGQTTADTTYMQEGQVQLEQQNPEEFAIPHSPDELSVIEAFLNAQQNNGITDEEYQALLQHLQQTIIDNSTTPAIPEQSRTETLSTEQPIVISVTSSDSSDISNALTTLNNNITTIAQNTDITTATSAVTQQQIVIQQPPEITVQEATTAAIDSLNTDVTNTPPIEMTPSTVTAGGASDLNENITVGQQQSEVHVTTGNNGVSDLNGVSPQQTQVKTPTNRFEAITFYEQSQLELTALNTELDTVNDQAKQLDELIAGNEADIAQTLAIAQDNMNMGDVRKLLDDPSFQQLLQSNKKEDIQKCFNLITEQQNRLTQLRSAGGDQQLITTEQQNLNQIRKQLDIKYNNVCKADKIKQRQSQLQSRVQQTQKLANQALKDNGIEQSQIQKILEDRKNPYSLQSIAAQLAQVLLGQNPLEDNPPAQQVPEIPVPNQEQLNRLKNEAMSRFSIVNDNPIIQGYYEQYMRMRLSAVTAGMENIDLQQINRLKQTFNQQFVQVWNNNQVLVPTGNGDVFSAVDKDEILKQQETQQPITLQQVAIEQLQQKTSYDELFEDALATPAVEEQQQPIFTVDQQPTIFFDEAQYQQDRSAFQSDMQVYNTQHEQLGLDFQSWKASGSDDITNYLADIKNEYVAKQLDYMLQNNKPTPRQQQIPQLYESIARNWDINLQNNTILLYDAQTSQFSSANKDDILSNLHQTLLANLTPPEMPQIADYIIENPAADMLNTLVPYSEQVQNGIGIDMFGDIVEPPLPEQMMQDERDHLPPEFYNQYYGTETEQNEQQFYYGQRQSSPDIETTSNNYENPDVEYQHDMYIDNGNEYENPTYNQYNYNDEHNISQNHSTYSTQDNPYQYSEYNQYHSAGDDEYYNMIQQYTTLNNNARHSNLYDYDEHYITPDMTDYSIQPQLDSIQNINTLEQQEKENILSQHQQHVDSTNSIISTISNSTSNIVNTLPEMRLENKNDQLLAGIYELIQATKPQVIYVWPSEKNDPPKINTYINI